MLRDLIPALSVTVAPSGGLVPVSLVDEARRLLGVAA